LFLPAGSVRRAALPVLFLLTGRLLGFSPRRGRGDTLRRSRGEIWQGGAVCSSLPNLTLIGSVGLRLRPQNLNFTNIIAPRGGSLHDSYKIYRFYARFHSTYICQFWLIYLDKMTKLYTIYLGGAF